MPTLNYTYTGAYETWVAPYNALVEATLMGASSQSALGGETKLTFTLRASDMLSIFVGGRGTSATAGGWNGGGSGGSGTTANGAGGGGATDIRLNGQDLEDRIAVAGGAGGRLGGDATGGGDGGGATGSDGARSNGGGGGSQVAGGTGGRSSGDGSLGIGGNASSGSIYGGGGGGGGYFGGGAGGSWGTVSGSGGGGGGSGYFALDIGGIATSGGSTQVGANPIGEHGSVRLVITELNQPPYPPDITTPALGEVIDKDQTNRISAPFNDPDAGDSQSRLDIRWWDLDGSGNRVGSEHTHTHSNPQQYWDAPGGTFTVGDKEMQAQSYDAQGEPSGWGSSTFFTAAVAPSPPTITYPANSGVVEQSDRVEWSTPNQDAYQVQVLDGAAVIDDTGEVAQSAPRLQVLSFPDNLTTRTIRVRVKHGGLWSPWASVTVLVSYTPPEPAGVTCTADPAHGAIKIAWTNTDPGSPVPSPVSVDIYVRTAAADDGKDKYRPYNGRGTRIARDLPPTSEWLDRRTAAGITYEYLVRTIGDNDVTADSGWTA